MTWMRIFRTRSTLAALVDAGAVALALALLVAVGWIHLPTHMAGTAAWVGVSIALGVLSVAYCGLYGLPALGNTQRSVPRIAVSSAMLGLATLPLARFALETPWSYVSIALFAITTFATLSVGRGLLEVLWRMDRFQHRVLIVGSGSLSERLRRQLRRAESIGIRLVGVLSNHELDPIGTDRFIGKVHEVDKITAEYNIDHVVVAFAGRETRFPADLLLSVKLSGVRIESGIDVSAALAERLPLEEIRPSELIFGDGFAPGRAYESLMRGIDIAGSVMILALTAPIIAAAMIGIRVTSRGPVIYRQQRIGRGGSEFTVLKLRTMTHNAEADTGVVFTSSDGDARVTAVGRLLRRTRIDELPQLWNILRGDMSLVGPRPERPEFADELQERYPYFYLRHAVRPGLTGLSQIRLGYVNDLDSWGPKLAHDVYYVKHRSLRLDLDILLATTRTVLLMRGM